MTNEMLAAVVTTAADSSPNIADLSGEFYVHDDSSANWLIRQIVERRAYAQRCAEWCEREQKRAKYEEEFLLFHYGPQLLEYARSRIEAAGGRRKSVNFPAGTVGFRAEAPKLIVDDESAIIAWAKTHRPQLVITTERLSKSNLNDHLKQTGELPGAGAHIEPAQEKFFIK